MRTDLQLADDQLVSMERFAIGGSRSVRGYRENSAVRDNGWISSVEFRIPLNLTLSNSDTLELAPFFDIGGAWNHGRNAKRQTLASAGVGLRYAWTRHFSAEVYWGGRLLDSDQSQSASGFQGHGVHMQIVGRIP